MIRLICTCLFIKRKIISLNTSSKQGVHPFYKMVDLLLTSTLPRNNAIQRNDRIMEKIADKRLNFSAYINCIPVTREYYNGHLYPMVFPIFNRGPRLQVQKKLSVYKIVSFSRALHLLPVVRCLVSTNNIDNSYKKYKMFALHSIN